ncbi:hypothetical protein C0J52_06665 [Blattella germanica]|nr:hypothetical protein C0J52_06665 [Blattella germanica]
MIMLEIHRARVKKRQTNSDSNTELTPPEISAKALEVSINLLPDKSRKMYEKFYRQFMLYLLECITLEVKKYIVAEHYYTCLEGSIFTRLRGTHKLSALSTRSLT